MITQFRKRPYAWSILAALVIILLGFVALTDAKNPKAADENKGGSREQIKALRVYEVNRTVADFGEKEDFSTPEAAYATINRVCGRGNNSDWARVSVQRLAKNFARAKPGKSKVNQEWADVLLNARIVEVRIWNGTHAVVMAELPQEFSSEIIRNPIDVRHLELEKGRWLNTGNDRADGVSEGRTIFDRVISRVKGKQATKPERARYFVRLVVGEDKMTFEGQEVTWEQLPELLKKVPNRSQTVLEFAVASKEMTVKQFDEARGRALKLREQLGFDYLSYVGKHPLGSKGSTSDARVKRGVSINTEKVKAELMGQVEHFFMNNYRDVTARKSIEWGEVVEHENGNRSIRYKYYATIWDRDILISNKVFTFDRNGNFASVRNVEGFPKKKPKKVVNTSTQEGMIDLVEDFFSKNFRDITSRKTIEWGEVEKHENGNSSIRYKYNATIWGKDKKIINQVFTFDPKGNFVSVKDVAESAQRPVDETANRANLDLKSPESTIMGFTRAAATGNAKMAQAYFLPNGEDYEDVYDTLTATPSSSRYPGRIMLEAVDVNAPIIILSQKETNYGLKVVWRVTFGKGFEIESHKFEPGATYDFDATLKRSEDCWLIDNF